MTLIVSCNKCGKELRSQDQYAGKRVRCSQCGTINQLPTQAAAMPAPLVESAFCFVCGKDFGADKDLVRDTKKRTYHRRCYEDASRYEQSRRQDEARRRSPQSTGGSHTASPARRAPVPKTPAPKAPSPAAAAPDDELVELTQLPAPSDDLWAELADLSGPANPLSDSSPFQGGSPVAFSGRRDSVWLYVLIGFGAAVPVVVLLFIAIQLLISSFTGPDQPVAMTDPAAVATEDQVAEETTASDGTTPEASPASPPPPAQPENPFLSSDETATGSAPVQPPPSDFGPPTSGSFPSPEWETGERSDQPVAANSGQPPASYRAGQLAGLLCLAVIGVPITAILLRMACSFFGETPPGFGAALGIAFAMFTAKALIGLLLNFVLGQGAGALVSLAAGLVTDGAIISGALPTSFGKGIGIALVIIVIAIGLAFTLGAIAFVIVMILAAAR